MLNQIAPMPETLSDAKIIELKRTLVDGARLELSDSFIAGLRLRLGPRKATWTVSHRTQTGTRVRHHLGNWPDLSVIGARSAAETYLKRMADTHDGSPTTVLQLIAAYANDRATTLKRGRETVRAIRRFLRPIGDAKVASLSSQDIMDCGTFSARLGPAAANRSLSYVRTMFNWAIAQDLCRRNPTTGVNWPAQEAPVREPLSPMEVVEIWDACAIVPPSYGQIVRLMILTLAREAEILGMTTDEVTLASTDNMSLWTIPARRSRTGTTQSIPLTPPASAILARLIAQGSYTELVFRTRKGRRLGGTSSRKAALDAWIEISRISAPSFDWKLGDIRHTFEYVMQYEEGLTRREINLCLDRKAPPKSQHDSPVSDLDTRRQVLETWWSLLEGWLIEYSTLPEWRARRSGEK